MLWINSKDGSGNWAGGFEATFTIGKGYLVNYPSDVTKNFTGTVNVADVPISGLTKTAGTYSGFHLAGNPFTSAIPLSFIMTEGSEYTIEAVSKEGISRQVYLTDLKLNNVQNLGENPVYSFTSASGDDPARFLLSFKPLGVETQPGENSGIYAYDKTIFISNPGSSTLEVYNMIGQKMVAEKTQNEPLYRVKIDAASGYYLVRLTSGQKSITEKVFIK